MAWEFYLISDRRLLPPEQFLPRIAAALDAGVRRVQLREKDLPAAELLPLAERLRRLTADYRAELLINDRIDVALAVAADGVHLGGHSLPVPMARKLIGPERLIGVSTHSREEIEAAATAGADFVTFGPVFDTPSKRAYGAPVGVKQLQAACAATALPVFALGGIDLAKAAQLKGSGIAGIAAIRALLTTENPAATLCNLLQIQADSG